MPVLHASASTRFGPNTAEVGALLDRVTNLSPAGRTALARHAPILVARSATSAELLCPNADAPRYRGLARYRRLARAPKARAETASALAAALELAEEGVAHLPPASRDAVLDAVCALVLRSQTSAHAYDILTRAVRMAWGPIHPGDVPVHP